MCGEECVARSVQEGGNTVSGVENAKDRVLSGRPELFSEGPDTSVNIGLKEGPGGSPIL